MFEPPPPQNILAESLEPQNLPSCIFKLSVIFVYSSLSCKVLYSSLWNLDASQEHTAPAFYPLGLSVSILLLLGGHFGGIISDYLATITVWANEQATPSSSVCLKPANKKLRLLKNMESDDGDGDASTNNSKDDDTITFRMMQEVPTVLTEDEKMSFILYWRRHANTAGQLARRQSC